MGNQGEERGGGEDYQGYGEDDPAEPGSEEVFVSLSSVFACIFGPRSAFLARTGILVGLWDFDLAGVIRGGAYGEMVDNSLLTQMELSGFGERDIRYLAISYSYNSVHAIRQHYET
jgi:hypothetical protein